MVCNGIWLGYLFFGLIVLELHPCWRFEGAVDTWWRQHSRKLYLRGVFLRHFLARVIRSVLALDSFAVINQVQLHGAQVLDTVAILLSSFQITLYDFQTTLFKQSVLFQFVALSLAGFRIFVLVYDGRVTNILDLELHKELTDVGTDFGDAFVARGDLAQNWIQALSWLTTTHCYFLFFHLNII